MVSFSMWFRLLFSVQSGRVSNVCVFCVCLSICNSGVEKVLPVVWFGSFLSLLPVTLSLPSGGCCSFLGNVHARRVCHHSLHVTEHEFDS